MKKKTLKYTNINWSKCEKIVLEIQRKIIAAWIKEDKNKVFKLQETLVNTFEARALAVRKVTTNQGKNTPGVDGIKITEDKDRLIMIQEIKNLHNYKASPVKRVMIPKKNGKLRPLGIPTIKDRCVQALYHLALDPIAETTADSRSYGFRKNRSTQDVQKYLRLILGNENGAEYIMDGDIKGFFDNISHTWILENIPINKKILHEWLKNGFIYNDLKYETTTGVPQGGIISPTIANMVLDGLQEIVEIKGKEIKLRESRKKYKLTGDRNYNPKINYVRYADDFIITADKVEYLEEMKPLITKFLTTRGVEMNIEKTKIYSIREGFDFLGFNFKKYNTSTKANKKVLYVTPTYQSIQEIREKIKLIFRTKRKPEEIILELNPILRGWGNYYRFTNAKRTYNKIRFLIHGQIISWFRRVKGKKSMKVMVKKHYFEEGDNKWEFKGVIEGRQIKLFDIESIPILLYIMVKNINPYLKGNEEYIEERISKEWGRNISPLVYKLANKQKQICPVCKTSLRKSENEQLEVHHRKSKADKGTNEISNLLVLHKTCHINVTNCNDSNIRARYVAEGIIILDSKNKI